jgi:hypothetical protein
MALRSRRLRVFSAYSPASKPCGFVNGRQSSVMRIRFVVQLTAGIRTTSFYLLAYGASRSFARSLVRSFIRSSRFLSLSLSVFASATLKLGRLRATIHSSSPSRRNPHNWNTFHPSRVRCWRDPLPELPNDFIRFKTAITARRDLRPPSR